MDLCTQYSLSHEWNHKLMLIAECGFSHLTIWNRFRIQVYVKLLIVFKCLTHTLSKPDGCRIKKQYIEGPGGLPMWKKKKQTLSTFTLCFILPKNTSIYLTEKKYFRHKRAIWRLTSLPWYFSFNRSNATFPILTKNVNVFY